MTCFLVYSSWHRKDTTQWADWFWLQQDWLANRLGTWAAKLASTSDGFPEATGKQEGRRFCTAVTCASHFRIAKVRRRW